MIDASHESAGDWVDETLRVWFEVAPVDATFVGLHEHDAVLPDPSPTGVATARDRLAAQQDVCPDPDASTPIQALDIELMSDALRIRLWEYDSRWMGGNPVTHTGEAAFGLMSLLLPQHAGTESDRLDALSGRLRGLPAFFEGAIESLECAPTAWTERALRECRGLRAFLKRGLPQTAVDDSEGVEVAIGAVASFERFLSVELASRPSERVGCGGDGLDLLVRRGHRLERSPAEIAAYAREELARTVDWARRNASLVGLDSPGDLGPTLRALHPARAGYYDAYPAMWGKTKTLSDARNLLTWPDFPIRYEPRPEWARAAAPDLYFLFYRSPAAYARPAVHTYMVAPLPEEDTDIEAFLATNNDSVIKLNHVVHHGGIGHHVQNWHAFRSPLRVGRIAAVDCASRIALFSGGTMAEGWACYATDLVAEAGGLTELEQFAEHVGRIRMCARAIVDVGLHVGERDLAQAAAFYREHAGMSASAAHSEAVKNSMFPGAALIYLVGSDLVHRLRADLMEIQGDAFDLCTFHDAFLSWGSIPVTVIAEQMRRRATLGVPMGAHDTVTEFPEEGL
jgi:hypothetical protein